MDLTLCNDHDGLKPVPLKLRRLFVSIMSELYRDIPASSGKADYAVHVRHEWGILLVDVYLRLSSLCEDSLLINTNLQIQIIDVIQYFYR